MPQKNFYINKVTIHNRNTGWFVAESNTGESVVGFSIIPPYGTISVEATQQTHKTFGQQWKCESVMYTDLGAITLSLLSSGLVEGISSGKAPAVYEAFGHEIWEILTAAVNGDELITFRETERNPIDLLQDVSGIGPSVARQMVRSWERERLYFTTAINAIRCGLSLNQYRSIIGDDPNGSKRIEFDMMVHNVAPFSIYDLVTHGISFAAADKLALEDWPDKIALDRYSPARFAGAVKHALRIKSQEGHMCAPIDYVDESVADLIGVADVMESFDDLNEVGLKVFGDMVYTKDSYEEEVSISQAVRRINESPFNVISMSDADIQSYADTGTELHTDQVAAIQMALNNKVSIVTGGPGVGKTTILKVLVRILKDKGITPELCAFTGAAARRMQIATEHMAETLHAKFKIQLSGFAMEEIKNGMLIIDEMSTVASDLFAMVMSRVYNDVRVLFVGDADQLPPVGAGEVFVQLIESDLPRVRLTKLFRNGGAIAKACADVNNGIMPAPDGVDFWLLNKNIVEDDIPVRLQKADAFLGTLGIKLAQILTPLNDREKVGRKSMNTLMQKIHNPNGEAVPFTDIRVGDQVVHLKNNRELGVRNGMVGKCIRRSDEARVALQAMTPKDATAPFQNDLYGGSDLTPMLDVMFDEEDFPHTYSKENLRQLDLGYAITIHKAQGNQFDAVIVVLPDLRNVPSLALRQIPYTAMSRAKKKLIVIAYPGALEMCVRNEVKLRRNSNLAAFLRGE